jgi:ABC-2 type transport system ATP-binding protein
MKIAITGLSHHYGNALALNNIELTLQDGFTLLLGPNGAGKSTLFGLLTGLQKIDCGDIRFNDHTLRQARAKIMARVGVVFQQSTLDIDLTVKQNLSYFASLHGITYEEGLSRIDSLLHKLDLSGRLNSKIRHLNGGHRRRVELARSLIHRPSILLLDEPTVGLDVASRQLILSVVKELAEQASVTVLWATHLFDEVQLDDSLVVLSKGNIIAHDKCSNLLTRYQKDDVNELWQHLMALQS